MNVYQTAPFGGTASDPGRLGDWEQLPHSLSSDRPVPVKRPKLAKPGHSEATPAGPRRLAQIDFQAVQPAYAALPRVKLGTTAERRRRKGAIKRATPLSDKAVTLVEDYLLHHSRSYESDLLKFRLSLWAGLRAAEIAELPLFAMLDASQRISNEIEVRSVKSGRAGRMRIVEMNGAVHEALQLLVARYPDAAHAAFSVGRDGTLRHQSAAAVANWFHRTYKAAGLTGCSSHSGRRTFATEVARRLGRYNSSVKDLQRLLGHSSLASTECYLEPSANVGQLVRSLGK